jgi:hypothetical protein
MLAEAKLLCSRFIITAKHLNPFPLTQGCHSVRRCELEYWPHQGSARLTNLRRVNASFVGEPLHDLLQVEKQFHYVIGFSNANNRPARNALNHRIVKVRPLHLSCFEFEAGSTVAASTFSLRHSLSRPPASRGLLY